MMHVSGKPEILVCRVFSVLPTNSFAAAAINHFRGSLHRRDWPPTLFDLALIGLVTSNNIDALRILKSCRDAATTWVRSLGSGLLEARPSGPNSLLELVSSVPVPMSSWNRWTRCGRRCRSRRSMRAPAALR